MLLSSASNAGHCDHALRIYAQLKPKFWTMRAALHAVKNSALNRTWCTYRAAIKAWENVFKGPASDALNPEGV